MRAGFVHSSILTLLVSVFSLVFGCSSLTGHQQKSSEQTSAETGEKLVSLKEILANQPDFVADEVFFQFEPRVHGGFSLGSRLAKKGDYYRSDFEGSVLFFQPNRPTVSYNPKEKAYREVPSSTKDGWYQDAIRIQTLVSEQNLTFEEVGTQVFEGHDCRKIKVTRNSSDSEDPTVHVYAAKDLKNLVIFVEVNLSDRTDRYILRNISFDVPALLFQPIEHYLGPRG